MLLRNRTDTALEVTIVTLKETEGPFTLEMGESAYFGDFKEGESLKVNSSNGSATILVTESELYWENTDDDFISEESIQSDGSLQFEEEFTSSSHSWSRHLNGICIRVTSG